MWAQRILGSHAHNTELVPDAGYNHHNLSLTTSFHSTAFSIKFITSNTLHGGSYSISNAYIIKPCSSSPPPTSSPSSPPSSSSSYHHHHHCHHLKDPQLQFLIWLLHLFCPRLPAACLLEIAPGHLPGWIICLYRPVIRSADRHRNGKYFTHRVYQVIPHTPLHHGLSH